MIFLVVGSSGFVTSCFGQVDTEFWFVAPEVWANHGDSPTLLRFASFDEPATITVEQPANSNFPTQTLTLSANNVVSLNLAPWLSQVENKPANTVLNYGIHISSTALVEAYYEVNPSNNLNPDIFALKGSNALGTTFVVPFQNYLNNAYSQSTSSFDIVAVEDSTIVTIVPTKSLIGHPANLAFTIFLDAGQTWSGRAASTLAFQHPTGTYVNSNKPIAITMSDDSVQGTPYGGCADIMGDQIVPTNIIGQEYIAIKGNLNGPDKVFIVGTEPGTTVYVNGNYAANLANMGSMYTHTLSADAAYYTSTNPVYVLHLTGFGCEVGGALLPPIVCTGSQEVAFIRSTSEFIGLKILVPDGSEGDFVFNGNENIINGASFSDVPGTAGAWKFANITATSFVPLLQSSRLQNTSSFFHLGMIHGGANSGTRYGYFSNYAAQAYVVQVNDNTLCIGQELELSTNTMIGATYNWSGPNGFSGQGNPLDFGTVDSESAGEYVVSGYVGGCPIENDTLNLLVYPVPEQPVIQPVDVFCEGEPLVLSTDSLGAVLYQWNGPNGPLPNNFEVTIDVTTIADSGTYSLTINDHGCISPFAQEEVVIIPHVDAEILTQNLNFCLGEMVTLEANPDIGENLVWTNPAGNTIATGPIASWNNAQSNQTGWYTLNGTSNGCPMGSASVWVQMVFLPAAPDVTVPVTCEGADALVIANSSITEAVITWLDPAGNVLGIGDSWLFTGLTFPDGLEGFSVVASFGGCTSLPEEFDLNVVPTETLEILDSNGASIDALTVCTGESFSLEGNGANGTSYQWSSPNAGIANGIEFTLNSAEANDAGWIVLEGSIGGCPMLADSTFLSVNPTPNPPELTDFLPVCEGSDITLEASANGNASIIWSHGTDNFEGTVWQLSNVTLQDAGLYSVATVLNDCFSENVTAELFVVAYPGTVLTDFKPIILTRCPGISVIMSLPEFDMAYEATWTHTDLMGNSSFFGNNMILETFEDGVYSVQLSTGSPCNLDAIGSFQVATIVCEMVIPNIISPNQDHLNDSFFVDGMNQFPRSTCSIYNRWGSVVFESVDFGSSAGWSPEETDVPDGTYYYVIMINHSEEVLTIEDQHGIREITESGPILLTGSLTIIR